MAYGTISLLIRLTDNLNIFLDEEESARLKLGKATTEIHSHYLERGVTEVEEELIRKENGIPKK